MADGIYDDQKNRGEGQTRDPAQGFYNRELSGPNELSAISHQKEQLSSDDLKNAEESPSGGESGGTGGFNKKEGKGGEGGGLYRKESVGDKGAKAPSKEGFLKRSRGFARRNRKRLIIGSMASLGIFAPLFIFLMLFLLALKTPHVVANITAWQFAKVTRAMARNSLAVMNEQAAMKAANNSVYTRLRAKYINMKDSTFRNLERVSSNIALRNLQGQKKLEFKEVPRSGALGKLGLKQLNSVVIDGEKVIIPKSMWSATDKYFHPIQTAKDRVAFYRAVDSALRTYNPQLNGYIRSQLAKKIITQRLNASLAGIIASRFYGKNGLDNAKEMQKQAYSNARSSGKANSAAPDEIKKATDDAKAATDECIDDVAKGGCLERTTTNTDGIPDDVANKINSNFEHGAFTRATTTVIGALNPIWNVVVPACLIYTGSILDGDNIDSRSDAVQRQAIQANSVDSQIKKGNQNTITVEGTTLSTAEPTDLDKQYNINSYAVGAFSNKLDGPDGNGITKSNAMLRAQGQDPNTLGEGNAGTQQSAMGGFGDTTIFDVLMPKNVAAPLNKSADVICPPASSLWAGGAVAVANILVTGASAISSAGTAAIAETGSQIALRQAATKVMNQLVQKVISTFTTKSGALSALSATGKFGKDLGKQVGLIVGATYLAKLIVVQNAGMFQNGIAVGKSAVDNVDNGNNQMASTFEQEMGGRAVTYAETAQSMEDDKKAMAYYNQTQSVFQRYFALENPNSLLTKFGYATVMKIDRTTVASLISSLGNIFNPLSLTSKMFGSLTSRAAAAEGVKEANYGNVQFLHLTRDEEKFVDSHPDFASPSENAYQFEYAGDEVNNKIDEKYSPCFKKKIGWLLTEEKDGEKYLVRKANGDTHPTEGICSPQQLSYENPEYGTLVFRYRLMKMYDQEIHREYGIQKAGTRP